MSPGTIYEEPRLLAQRSELGYTPKRHLALAHEPEAISEDDQRTISVRARAQFAELRFLTTDRRDRQMWLDRLRRGEQRAVDKGVDIFKPQAVIRQQIIEIERLTDDAA